MNFSEFSFAASSYIWFFPLVLICGTLSLYRIFRVKRVCTVLAGSRLSLLYGPTSWGKQICRMFCISGAVLFLYVALLRPQVPKNEEKVIQEGRDLFIAFDVSRSMLAPDVAPNRLSFAKEKIKELISLLGCERIGLILFSGAAFVQCPLTADYSAFTMFLDAIDVETISSGTTALDKALRKTLDAFSSVPSKKSKLLLIVTDGEDFSTHLAAMQQEAREKGVHIFTLGVGTKEGAPIPVYNALGEQIGHQKDQQGNIVISRLNEDMLHNLAQGMGGMYMHLEQNSQLQKLVNAIERFEKDEFEEKNYQGKKELYPFVAALAFGFLLLEWIL